MYKLVVILKYYNNLAKNCFELPKKLIGINLRNTYSYAHTREG